MLMVQTRGEIWLKMQNARCALQNRTSCSRLGPAPRKRVTKEPVSTRGKTDAQAICLPPKEEDFNQPTLRRFTDNWHSLLHLFPCLSYSALKPLQLVRGQHSWGLGLDISFIEKKNKKSSLQYPCGHLVVQSQECPWSSVQAKATPIWGDILKSVQVHGLLTYYKNLQQSSIDTS